MSRLADQLERDRFTSSHAKNISVIAPAGVGKTHAIVARIVAIASQPEALALDRLPRLVVVTYSVRAAQEMQQRSRAAIRQAGLPLRVQRAFQQAFFGTIHSYCVRLLERFGHYLGLPFPVALLQNHTEWWNRFLVRGLGSESAADASLAELFHFFVPDKLYALGREVEPGATLEIGPCPTPDVQPLLNASPEGLHHSTKRSVTMAQEAVMRWSEAWARGDRFHPLPTCPTTQKAPEFIALWSRTFAPLHEWLRLAALAFGTRIANAYEAFRLSESVMTYDDQVRIALRLLEVPAVQRELAEEAHSVLLDEAQDTDPRQFDVLLRVAGLGPGMTQRPEQSFCIVGDFQQAIYTPRSDLSVYRKIHDQLILEPRGGSSQLKVTFRCDQAIIRFVNKIFPTVLHGAGEQSAFFDLMPRHAAGPGLVARLVCPDEPNHAAGKKIVAEVRASHEARVLAERIKEGGPAALGAKAWSQVAILCPRKNWLLPIARELRTAGLPVQLHSSDDTPDDRTPRTWMTALTWVVAHPEDPFEIAGVLREIFGVSDHNMALYTNQNGERLRLDRPLPTVIGPVEEALEVLRDLVTHAALPLHQLMQRVLEKTRLRERLRSISDLELEDAEDDLDDFTALIFRRSAEGATLQDLAQELRLSVSQSSSNPEEIRDAIQLLTSYKAKGLEWQTVILPFMFRSIEFKTPAYPQLVQGRGGDQMIFRDKDDYTAHAKALVLERDREQLQRLLYVMCTRAKHTLVLIDDEVLFGGQLSRGGSSAGELLNFLGGLNRITWKALPETLTSVEVPSAGPIDLAVESPRSQLEMLPEKDVARAIASARAIPRRITPHTLVELGGETDPEERMDREEDLLTNDAESPGILYGLWWHAFVQSVPWEEPRDVWEQSFHRALSRSPQAERSMREWNLFFHSPLAHWLADSGRIIHREFPFLWRDNSGACLEGVMDLAVYTPSESVWQVIDWKTNRVQHGEGAVLAEGYRGQIQAYARAVGKMLSAEVIGSLYLTSSGEWIPVK